MSITSSASLAISTGTNTASATPLSIVISAIFTFLFISPTPAVILPNAPGFMINLPLEVLTKPKPLCS